MSYDLTPYNNRGITRTSRSLARSSEKRRAEIEARCDERLLKELRVLDDSKELYKSGMLNFHDLYGTAQLVAERCPELQGAAMHLVASYVKGVDHRLMRFMLES